MRIPNSKWRLAVGLLVGGIIAYQSRFGLQQWFRSHQFRAEGFEQVPPSEIYFLETNRWLTFEIPKDTPIGRVISNASISSKQEAAPDTQWPYAIEYQILGNQGRTNSSGVYYFLGEHAVFRDKHSGKSVEVNSYLDGRVIPLSGRYWVLNLTDPAITNASILRLRLHSSHPDILEVGVRAYFRAEVSKRKLTYLWDRLSVDQKRDLARGNVYSFEGLNAMEKLCVLRFHWAGASPIGIPGHDFRRNSIYVRDDVETLQGIKDWTPAGLAIDAEHFGVLPITNETGVCQLRMVDYAPATAPQIVSNTFLWYDEWQQEIETNRLGWYGTNQVALSSNRNGLLQIASSRPIYVRTFHVAQGQTNETTPEPLHLLTFACSPTNSVEYDVAHVEQGPTLLRLDLRRGFISAKSSNTDTSVVHYALLAENGNTLQADDVILTNQFSPYDWLVASNALTNVSAPQSLCFILPENVWTLRVSSPDKTVLVNAYSRPAQLIKKIRVPEDYSRAGTTKPEQPSWFTVQPRDHMQRREMGQDNTVHVQTRPPEYDPVIETGEYEWTSFLPPEAQGQMLLIPPTDGRPPRPDKMSFSYFPVKVGGKQRVRFETQPGQSQVEPTLFLVFTNGSTSSATVTVDDQTLLDNRLQTPVTAIHLGNLKVGEHELGINASNSALAFLNYLDRTTNAAFLQRFCTIVSSNIMTFPYVKQQTNAEILVLKIFSPLTNHPQPFEVGLKLKTARERNIGPFSELTFLERQVRVTPDSGGPVWLVAAANARLDDGETLFFPIGPDLPPGPYELEIKMAADSPRWLSLSRTTPGLAEKLNVTTQRRID